MDNIAKVARRTFLIGTATVAGGVAFGLWYVTKPYPNPLKRGLGKGETTFNPYIKIASDNTITVIAPRVEMGQGISTTLAAFVAEELDVPLEMLKVEIGPTSPAYFNDTLLRESAPYPWFNDSLRAELLRDAFGAMGKAIGLQTVAGSSSIRDGFDRMRQAGAATRHMLVQAAAKRFGVKPEELKTDNARVVHIGSGRSLTYGELAADAEKVSPPSSLKLKDQAE